MTIIGREKVPGGSKYTVQCQGVDCQNRKPPSTFSFTVPEPEGTYKPICPICGKSYVFASSHERG